jgi:UDP-N-acetylmuramoylalanine--D-glutamate ligase
MKLDSNVILVLGAGISGIGAAKLILGVGGDIILYDGNRNIKEKDIIEQIGSEEGSVRFVSGELTDDILNEVALCVVSPGISLETLEVQKILEADIAVIGELELAYQTAEGNIVAITGTNGKTTTTALVGEIMQHYFKEVFVVGNIGTPYADVSTLTTKDSHTVIEVSSFQLETTHEFRPNVSAILNLTPDHLDRHITMENYLAAKLRIAENQTKEDILVINYDDEKLVNATKELKPKLLYFSSKSKLEKGVYLDNGEIIYNSGLSKNKLCNVKELKLMGTHNYENVMAAIAITVSVGVPISVISEAIKEFESVEHRIEYVLKKDGVMYYNDSKGTNPDAGIKAIKAMDRPTLLIAGGYDKDSDFSEWIKAFKGKVRQLVLIGQTRDKIAAAAKKEGYTNVIYAGNLEEAVRICYAYAMPGDAVLLSPACASWGMFKNYEQRGNLFKEYVHNL